jgi:predicted signal transduction protein with EAL and GGDEF domain
VETLDELDLVRMLGCSHIQGYIYERPLSAENTSTRLATGLIAIARGSRSFERRQDAALGCRLCP